MDKNVMEKNRGGGNKNKQEQRKGMVQEHEQKTANQQGRQDQPFEPRRRDNEPRREQDSPQQPGRPTPSGERSDEETIGRPVQLTPEKTPNQ